MIFTGDDVSAYLFFLDDKTGAVLKRVEIPTWMQVFFLSFIAVFQVCLVQINYCFDCRVTPIS